MNRNLLSFFFIALCGLLHASDNSIIDKHLKKINAVDKKGYAGIKNIDFIYTINLDKRPEKFNHCLEQLVPFGIVPFRFSAINGWEKPVSELNDLGVKYKPEMIKDLWGTCYFEEDHGQPHHEILHVPGRNYFSHCMSRGAIAIVLSHLSILKDAYNSSYKTIWVMEDDIQVIKNPHLISSLIKELNHLVGENKWDILFTDQDTKNNNGQYVPCRAYARRPNFTPAHPERFAAAPHNVSSTLRKVTARYGAYSMIVSRAGMKKLLDFFRRYNIFLPYDMEFYLPNDMQLYSVTEDIVSTTPNSPSDNGGPGYSKIKA
ncbi:MAG: glycosyltransferase family 25 protein [Candidatus Babeliales bacterium]|jgi:GR25 family glycosyltransferase involved in LPS biosynthesis